MARAAARRSWQRAQSLGADVKDIDGPQTPEVELVVPPARQSGSTPSSTFNLGTVSTSDVPVLFAANYLRTELDEANSNLSKGFFLSFYRVVRELYSFDSPDWPLGGARADGRTGSASGGRTHRLSLDGRIRLDHVSDGAKQDRLRNWMTEASELMGLDHNVASALNGVVFEIRQGYKSKDSKRQNADIANAGTAYSQGYLPVLTLLSTQIDSDIADRYTASGWLLLRGYLSDSPLASTYCFASQILGYDLAGFFKQHTEELKGAVVGVLQVLLGSPEK